MDNGDKMEEKATEELVIKDEEQNEVAKLVTYWNVKQNNLSINKLWLYLFEIMNDLDPRVLDNTKM